MRTRVFSSAHPTRLALFWMHLASEPFVALFTLLGFILKKELGASAFQLSIFASLSPIISFFSFYLGSLFSHKSHWLIPNLIVSFVLGRVLFVILPLYSSATFVIIAAVFYQLFNKASTPSVIELIKLTVEEKKRHSLFSTVYFFNFLESLCLGLFIGKVLDGGASHWKWSFSIAALFSMTSVFFQKRILVEPSIENQKRKRGLSFPFIESLLLLKKDSSFRYFQWGFMIGGIGLMVMNPALIFFYDQHLHLCHEKLTSARYIWMGLGVLSTTFLWEKHLQKEKIFLLVSLIVSGFGLFSALMLMSEKEFLFFYLAFFIYGVAQAGSHLLWHLSGVLFSQEEESSYLYTTTNILMVGIRGLFAPMTGGILTFYIGACPTLVIGSAICFLGAGAMLAVSYKTRRLSYAKR